MKKILSAILALTLASSVITGCSSQSAASGSAAPAAGSSSDSASSGGDLSGKLTMWLWTEQPLVDEAFKALHPGVEIENVIIESGDYVTKIQSTLASGGQLPDILWGEISFRGKLFNMDILEDLSAAPYNFDKSTVYDYLIPTMSNDEGKILGVETTQVPAAMAYRRDLAKEYFGVEEPAEMEALFPDWDTFIAKGKEVSQKSNGTIFMLPSLGDAYYLMNGQSKEPRIVGDTVNMKAVTNIVTDIAKFRDAGIVNKIDQWTPAWFAAFGGGENIFYPLPCWGIDNWIKPNDPDGNGNWGLMVPPGGGFSWGGSTLSITKTSQNKELAWEYIKFCNLDPAGNDIKKEMTQIPISIENAKDPYFSTNEDPYFNNQNVSDVWMNRVIPTIHANPVTAYDLPDIIAFEMLLSTMNADYATTAEQAVEIYKTEVLEAAPELIVE